MSKKPLSDTDPIQSEKFRKSVREIEADGALSPIEADAKFEQTVTRVVAAKKPAPGA